MDSQLGSEWLVIVQDVNGQSYKREEATQAHVDAMKMDGNRWLWGGPLFSHACVDGKPFPPMIGSAFLYWAVTKEEVIERIAQDPMAKEGIWDVRSAQIWHTKSMVRLPLSTPTD